MFQSKNFRFRTNISVDGYQTKDEASACLSKNGAAAVGKRKMAFREADVSVDDFLTSATTGHAFCNLFEFDVNQKYNFDTSTGPMECYPVYKRGELNGAMKLSFKSDRFFKASQTVFVDVDFTRFQNVQDYINCLTLKPTCVYMSFSDKKEKKNGISRRFRLVYVFDRLLDKHELMHVSQAINDRIILDTGEPMEDECGKRISQYMNGVYGNSEAYADYWIYDYNDFPEDATDVACIEVEKQPGMKVEFNPQLVDAMSSLDYNTFMHYHSLLYKYAYRMEKPEWKQDLYQLTDENYLQLYFYVEKQVDGQHRRRKLFKNACLRRLMFPDMDPDTMLFNLYVDRERFFDNSDGVIDIPTLQRKVTHAFAMDYEQLVSYCNREVNEWHHKRPKFILKPGTRSDRGMLSHLYKQISLEAFQNVYDRNLSVSENVANGVGFPVSTVYRYCQELGYSTNPIRNGDRMGKEEKVKLFQQYYNPDISVRANAKELENHGLVMGKSTIDNWSKKYFNQQTTECAVAPNEAQHGFFTPCITEEDLDLEIYLEHYYLYNWA